jgi:hypothetical protein
LDDREEKVLRQILQMKAFLAPARPYLRSSLGVLAMLVVATGIALASDGRDFLNWQKNLGGSANKNAPVAEKQIKPKKAPAAERKGSSGGHEVEMDVQVGK